MNDSHTSDGVSGTDLFLERLERRIAELCAEREAEAAEISPDAAAMVRRIARLASGGKRVRAQLAFNAFVFCGGDDDDDRAVDLGATIELFQAAALIHDDIIDRSDTRRGGPSVHRSFEALHRESGWALDAEHFGEAAAILTGDLALAMADESFARLDCTEGARLRRRFNRMKWEVMAGQYLDIVEEVAAPTVSRSEAADRAMTVLRYKSAKYTFEHPTALGAILAGADADREQELADLALPIGEAFQLADDDLGVFGDPMVTGKPAGDDLREGKRTLLVAFALEKADPADCQFLTDILGRQDMKPEDISRARAVLEGTGARRQALAAAERLADEGITRLDRLASAEDHGDGRSGDSPRAAALSRLRHLALAAVGREH